MWALEGVGLRGDHIFLGRIGPIPDDKLYCDRRAVVRRISVPHTTDKLLDDRYDLAVIEIETSQLQQLHLLVRCQIIGIQEANLQISAIAAVVIVAVQADGIGSHRPVKAHAEVRAPAAVISQLQRCRLLGLGKLVLRFQIRRLPGLRSGFDIENGDAGLRINRLNACLGIGRRLKGVALGGDRISRVRSCGIPDDQLYRDRLPDVVRARVPHAAGELLDLIYDVIVCNFRTGKPQKINSLVLLQRVREQEADLILLAEAVVLPVQADAVCGNGAVKGDAIIGAPVAIVSLLLFRGRFGGELVFRLQRRGLTGLLAARIIERNALFRLQRLYACLRKGWDVPLLLHIEVAPPSGVILLLEIDRHDPGLSLVDHIVPAVVGIPGPIAADDLDCLELITNRQREVRQHVFFVICGVYGKLVCRGRLPVVHRADQIIAVLHNICRRVIGDRLGRGVFRRRCLLRLCCAYRARVVLRIRGDCEREQQRERHQKREPSFDVFHAVSSLSFPNHHK